jgi:beta-1,4-mannosyltransferase
MSTTAARLSVVAEGSSPATARTSKSARQPLDWPFIISAVSIFAAALAALYLIQDLGLARSAYPPVGWAWWVSTIGQALWCVPVIAGVLGAAGMLLQRREAPPDPSAPKLPNLVVFRFVTRGFNTAVLLSAIQSVADAMAMLPLFEYRIEVCTESAQPGLPPGVVEYVIPADYTTKHGTLWKARALQYALENSQLPDDAWILHCDEESHITQSLVWGTYQAIAEEEASGAYRIGQGRIVYINSLDAHPVLTLADSTRTGDDMGRFHWQNRVWHRPYFGLHGSFILVRQLVERQAGFDYGPAGSVTEDAFWALAVTGLGYRTRWVDGVMIEQAPERVIDFLRQRRRWFSGLWKTARHAPVPLRTRLPLATFTALWSVAWMAILYTYLNYAMGWHTMPVIQAIGNISFASYILIYVIGLRTALAMLPGVGLVRKVVLYAAQVAGMLVFPALEAAGVVYALVRPIDGFYVMPKQMTPGVHRRPAAYVQADKTAAA